MYGKGGGKEWESSGPSNYSMCDCVRMHVYTIIAFMYVNLCTFVWCGQLSIWTGINMQVFGLGCVCMCAYGICVTWMCMFNMWVQAYLCGMFVHQLGCMYVYVCASTHVRKCVYVCLCTHS